MNLPTELLHKIFEYFENDYKSAISFLSTCKYLYSNRFEFLKNLKPLYIKVNSYKPLNKFFYFLNSYVNTVEFELKYESDLKIINNLILNNLKELANKNLSFSIKNFQREYVCEIYIPNRIKELKIVDATYERKFFNLICNSETVYIEKIYIESFNSHSRLKLPENVKNYVFINTLELKNIFLFNSNLETLTIKNVFAYNKYADKPCLSSLFDNYIRRSTIKNIYLYYMKLDSFIFCRNEILWLNECIEYPQVITVLKNMKELSILPLRDPNHSISISSFLNLKIQVLNLNTISCRIVESTEKIQINTLEILCYKDVVITNKKLKFKTLVLNVLNENKTHNLKLLSEGLEKINIEEIYIISKRKIYLDLESSNIYPKNIKYKII